MRCERQEPRVVDRLAIFPASDDDFHVVIKTHGSHSPQVFEGRDMLTNCRFKILSLGEADILPPGVTKNIAEQFNSTATFLSEVDMVRRPIHLSLRTWRGLKADRFDFRLDALLLDIGAKGGVAPFEAEFSQLFEGSQSRYIGITLQQLLQLV